jgi:hypothetical protein
MTRRFKVASELGTLPKCSSLKQISKHMAGVEVATLGSKNGIFFLDLHLSYCRRSFPCSIFYKSHTGLRII